VVDSRSVVVGIGPRLPPRSWWSSDLARR
jgi:hypothetical protein